MKTKNEYIESLASELKSWSAQIDILTIRTENASANLKAKYSDELDSLRTKQQAAANKMRELQDDSDDAWESIKVSADQVWKDLRIGIADAASKFD